MDDERQTAVDSGRRLMADIGDVGRKAGLLLEVQHFLKIRFQCFTNWQHQNADYYCRLLACHDFTSKRPVYLKDMTRITNRIHRYRQY